MENLYSSEEFKKFAELAQDDFETKTALMGIYTNLVIGNPQQRDIDLMKKIFLKTVKNNNVN